MCFLHLAMTVQEVLSGCFSQLCAVPGPADKGGGATERADAIRCLVYFAGSDVPVCATSSLREGCIMAPILQRRE